MSCNCSKKVKRITSTRTNGKRKRAPITRAPKLSRVRSTISENTVDLIGACGGNFTLVKRFGGPAPKLKAISNIGSCTFTLVADDGRFIIPGSEISLNPGGTLATYQVPATAQTVSFRCSGSGGTCRLRMTPC